MLQVAGGVAPHQAVDVAIGQALDGSGAHEAFALRGHGLGYLGLLAFEVVGDAAGRVQAAFVLEHGPAHQPVFHAIQLALGLHGVGAVIHGDEGRLEVGVAIHHAGPVVEPGHLVRHIKLNGVLGGVVDGGFNLAPAPGGQLERVAGAAHAIQ